MRILSYRQNVSIKILAECLLLITRQFQLLKQSILQCFRAAFTSYEILRTVKYRFLRTGSSEVSES